MLLLNLDNIFVVLINITKQFQFSYYRIYLPQTALELELVVASDGNFRLARKKSAGRSYGEPFHKGKFFMPSPDMTTTADIDLSSLAHEQVFSFYVNIWSIILQDFMDAT